MSLLQVDALEVCFAQGNEQVTAVDALSFSVDKGECLAIVGESGSGKSVSAMAIMRLLPDNARQSGRIQLTGSELNGLTESQMQAVRGKRIGMVFQEPMSALNPLHPIGRQIDEMIRLHQPQCSKAQRLALLHDVLDQVGLGKFHDRLQAYPHQLSGGERQRVMIAMAIVNAPELLIADEPTTALDVTLQAQILTLLKKLQREREMGLMLITHDLTIVEHIADRVLVMRHGKAEETAPVQQLFRQPATSYSKQLLASVPKGEAVALAHDAKPVLSTDGLSVRYGKSGGIGSASKKFTAVNSARLSLREGETLGIVGESGSGKSSLGLALLRLIASDGPILFLGQDITGLRGRALRALRQSMQIVFQDPYASLNPRLTVCDIVSEGLRVHQPALSASEREAKAAQALESVGLEVAMLYRLPHEFSGGQRQRISIARSIILSPRVIVLDEPTSALDVSVQAQVLELLKRFQQQEQLSYLFISHDLRVVRAISHNVIVMREGEIIEQAETHRLFEHPQHEYTRRLIRTAFAPIAEAD